jgi:hypothetical protein
MTGGSGERPAHRACREGGRDDTSLSGSDKDGVGARSRAHDGCLTGVVGKRPRGDGDRGAAIVNGADVQKPRAGWAAAVQFRRKPKQWNELAEASRISAGRAVQSGADRRRLVTCGRSGTRSGPEPLRYTFGLSPRSEVS